MRYREPKKSEPIEYEQESMKTDRRAKTVLRDRIMLLLAEEGMTSQDIGVMFRLLSKTVRYKVARITKSLGIKSVVWSETPLPKPEITRRRNVLISKMVQMGFSTDSLASVFMLSEGRIYAIAHAKPAS